MSIGRATIIDVHAPLATADEARAWLSGAGEEVLAEGIEVLNRTLHVFRLVTADPYLHAISRRQALVARVGFGAGEQVADGLWTEARELLDPSPRPRRLKVLHPQARLAAVLTGNERALACEELTLRARLDLDHGRPREAALQLLVALDAALAELAVAAWTTGHEGTAWEDIVRRTCRGLGGFDPDIRHRTNDSVLSFALVADGQAVTLLPELVEPAAPPGVAVRSIAEGTVHRTIFAATRSADAERPSVQALLGAVRTAAGILYSA